MKTTPLIKQLALSVGLGVLLIIAATPRADAALIAQFRFDEGTGTTATNLADLTSPGRFSTSGATWTTDVPNNFVVSSAYHNDGRDGAYVAVRGDAPGFATIADITVTGWINASQFVGTAGGYDRIVSKRTTAGTQSFDIGFRSTTGGVGIGVAFSTLAEVITPAVDFASGWIFFAVTRQSSTGAISIYLGNTDPLTGLSLSQTGVSASGAHSNPADLMIGNTAAGTSARAAVASYSDFRFYDEVLDITALNQIRISNLQAIPEPSSIVLVLTSIALILLPHKYRRNLQS